MNASLEKSLESKLRAAIRGELDAFADLLRSIATPHVQHQRNAAGNGLQHSLTSSFRHHADTWVRETITQGVDTAAVILSLMAEELSPEDFLGPQQSTATGQRDEFPLAPSAVTDPQDQNGTASPPTSPFPANNPCKGKQLLGGLEVPTSTPVNHNKNGHRRGGPLNRPLTIKFMRANGFTFVRSSNEDVYKHGPSGKTVILATFHGCKTEIPSGAAKKLCRELSDILGTKLQILSGRLCTIETAK